MIDLDSIIKGCRNGDSAMQKALYDRYSARFYALSLRYSPDAYIAKEILTEGFLMVFNNVSKYDGRGSFEGWMQTIFVRMAIKIYRRDRRHQVFDEEEGVADNLSVRPDMERQMDLREVLSYAMSRLSDDQRLIFNMIAVEEYTFIEASVMLDMPESTLKSKYYRIQQTMKDLVRGKLGKEVVNF